MPNLNTVVPGLNAGFKILPSEIANYGIMTTGTVFWVDADNGSDTDDGLSANTAFKTIAKAYSMVTTNNNDVIMLSANAAHVQTSMLDITKNRVHFVGASLRGGSYGLGARSRITMGDSTVSADIALMKNTGVGNTFTGIKFDSSSTVAASLYCVAEGGEYAIYDGCEFYKSTDLNETAAAEVLNNGDSAQWLNCVFGSTANETVGAVIRANMLLTATIAGSKCRDNIVDNCIFMCKAGNTAKVMVYGANATDVERLFYMKNCLFFNSILAAADPAHAVGFGAAQTEGQVILKDCTSVLCTVMKQASRAIYVDGAVPTQNTSGVAVTG